MKKYLVLAIVLAVGVLLGLLLAKDNTKGEFAGSQSSMIATLTQSVFTASTTPTLISSNDKQGYRVFSNTGSNTVFLFISSTSTGITSSTASKGIAVFSNSRYEMNSLNYIYGQVYAILPSGTSTISVGE